MRLKRKLRSSWKISPWRATEQNAHSVVRIITGTTLYVCPVLYASDGFPNVLTKNIPASTMFFNILVTTFFPQMGHIVMALLGRITTSEEAASE